MPSAKLFNELSVVDYLFKPLSIGIKNRDRILNRLS